MVKMQRRLFIWALLALSTESYSQYQAVEHRKLVGGEVPVQKEGCYSVAGATYVLTRDVSGDRSTIFLGKDVTLDLNGYTLRFADGNYEHVPNSGFEEGTRGWDLSKAPGANIENTADVHVFLGKKLMSLKAGDEITSSYITLPVANRSYFAMCGITGHYWHDMKKYPDDEMKVSVFVEDINGNEVKCMSEYNDGKKQSCPAEMKSPRLGGGFVYAHLTGLPAGKYRVRIRAENDCLVDEIDIRPAMDAGISIIETTNPLADYDHVIMESYPPTIPTFYDYTEDFSTGKPLTSVPSVSGSGTIMIRNGTIENMTPGIQSWGIQSSAPGVRVILENVRIRTSGISTGAADILCTTIRNCTFETDMPFLIQRHVNLCSVLIRGNRPSEVSGSEFLGGQGCLSIKGKYSLVHDNLFVNDQWVTNHYSIMGTGDSSKIYNNRFEPKQGSGIYVTRYTEVYDNIFKIETSAPTCEYGREEYSTAAIRLGDYNARPGSDKASVGNRIHNNRIFINAVPWPEPAAYLPMSWGIYYSASGGENYVYDNDIEVNKTDTAASVLTAAFYVCGGPKYFGGQFYNNRILTNVPAGWIASMYGGASNSDLYNNTVKALDGARFSTFRIGSAGCDDCVAKNIRFRSNHSEGQGFSLDVTDQDHSYSVFWTLGIELHDANGLPLGNTDVSIIDNNGKTALRSRTDPDGKISAELIEYSVDGKTRKSYSPYIIKAGKYTKEVVLDSNKQITIP
jgi:hypothetical protein